MESTTPGSQNMPCDIVEFDPYHEWLGIHPSEQPADFYRLLGVCRFENNVAAIQGAYVQRFHYLQRFRNSNHGAEAERLIQELASAQTLLLSPVLKASYDTALQATIQPPPAPPPEPVQQQVFQEAPQSQYESEPFPAFNLATRPIVRTKQRQSSNNPLAQFAGSIGGLVLGFLILCFLRPEYDRFHLFHSAIKDQPEAEGGSHGGGDKPEEFQPVGNEDDDDFGPLVPVDPDPGPPRRPPPPDQPGPPPALPRIDIPPEVVVPAIGDNDFVEIAAIGNADVEFDIRNPEGNSLTFTVTGGEDQQSWSITDGNSPIARLQRENGKVNLYWQGGVSKSAECLRNTLLAVTVGGDEHTVRMRSTKSEEAPLVDLSKTIMTFPIDVELYGLQASQLRFEVVGTENGMTAQRFDPVDQKANADQKVRLILRDQPPYAAFDFSLSARGAVLAAKVWPIMAGEDQDTAPWTIKSVNTIYRRLNEKIAAATQAVQQLPKVIQNIKSTISKLKSVSPNSPLYFAAQNDLVAAQIELEQAEAALADAKAGIPRWQKRGQDLKVLADLGNSINGTMRISYRVFYLVAGHEVDLFQATGNVIAAQPIVKPRVEDEVEKPQIPKARKIENPIAADIYRSLDTARSLLSSRELEASRSLLEGLLVPEEEELKNSVENAKLVQHYVERFWNAVREGLKTLESGKDFPIGDADRAAVVEVAKNRERITLRIGGENRTYSIADLPTDAAVGIADQWLAKDDPNSKVFIAVFIAVESPERIEYSRKLLREARSSGSDVAQAVLEALDEG